MAQAAFNVFQSEVLSVAAACPLPTINRSVRNAIIELAEKAGCFRFTLDTAMTIADVSTLEFDLPVDTVLVKPISLSIGGEHIKPYSVRMLNEDTEDWRNEIGTPTHWLRHQNDLNSITLYPIPNASLTVQGEVAIKPSRSATGFDEVYIDRFYTTIVDGALARLLAVPSAPWYTPDVAAYHKMEFENRIDDARRVADADDVHKRRSIRYGGL